VRIHVKGGATFGKFAPPVPYTQNVLVNILKKMGYDASIEILKHGFYPKGGADVEMTVHPFKELEPLKMRERGRLDEIEGISIASTHLEKAHVATRQAAAAKAILEGTGLEPNIETIYVDSVCPGSGIVLWAKAGNSILGADGLGEPGKPSETVGKEAASKLMHMLHSGASVDPNLSDQLLPLMAFANGKSSMVVPELTMHAKTNMWVVQQFMDVGFESHPYGENVLIECTVL
jgi:RNA 3'-phosphate cyclase